MVGRSKRSGTHDDSKVLGMGQEESWRQPMKNEIKLGEFADPGEKRDAIHIAVAPVIAAEKLAPGQDIGFTGSSGDEFSVGTSPEPIGIVDPFLKGLVLQGQRFWMFLYPNTITSLRHDWEHPAFDADLREISRAWLAAFAEDIGLALQSAIGAGEAYINTGEYHTFLGHDTP